MRMFVILIVLVILCPCAHAEIYKWMDDKGTTHFTDDPATIPEKYRDQAKSRLTEEDLLTPEEKARTRQRSERESRERLDREDRAYETSVQEEKSRRGTKEREHIQYEDQIRADKEERSRKLEEERKPSGPEYAQISCSRCNGSGTLWKRTKALKTVGRASYWIDGPQIATKCPDCNGKGFTLQRIK